MISICSQCVHRTGDRNWCNDCNGNPKLRDNFKQKPPAPLIKKPVKKPVIKSWGMRRGYKND